MKGPAFLGCFRKYGDLVIWCKDQGFMNFFEREEIFPKKLGLGKKKRDAKAEVVSPRRIGKISQKTPVVTLKIVGQGGTVIPAIHFAGINNAKLKECFLGVSLCSELFGLVI